MFRPLGDRRRGYAARVILAILKGRQLNGEIANRGAFRGSKNDFEAGALGRESIEQRILASAANDEQAFQLSSR